MCNFSNKENKTLINLNIIVIIKYVDTADGSDNLMETGYIVRLVSISVVSL